MVFLYFKKFVVWLKNYWWIPVLIVGIAISVIFLRHRPDALVDALKFRIKKNEEEQAELEHIKLEEIKAKAAAEKRAQEELKRIAREYDEAKEHLAEDRKKEVERLLKKDPKKLAGELEDLMGFKVIIVED